MAVCKVEGCEKPLEPNRRTKICGMHRTRWQKYKAYDLPDKEILPEGIIKKCIHHGELTKEHVKIYPRKGRNYPQIKCKKCAYNYTKTSNNRFRERVRKTDNAHYAKNRNRHIETRRIRQFGISQDQFNQMLLKQNNVCAICKNPETVVWKKTNTIKPLCIDHCHKTGKIRGLLCARCNTAIGLFKDSLNALISASEYLKAHP